MSDETLILSYIPFHREVRMNVQRAVYATPVSLSCLLPRQRNPLTTRDSLIIIIHCEITLRLWLGISLIFPWALFFCPAYMLSCSVTC